MSFQNFHSTVPSPRARNSETAGRPPNAWILYRADRARELRAAGDTRSQTVLSQDIASAWRDESGEVRAHYDRLAAQRKEEHRRMHPGYQFHPRACPDRARLRYASESNESPLPRSSRVSNSRTSERSRSGSSQGPPSLLTVETGHREAFQVMASSLPASPVPGPSNLRRASPGPNGSYSHNAPHAMFPTPQMLLNPPHSGDFHAYLSAQQARRGQYHGSGASPVCGEFGIDPKQTLRRL
ncbi:hypothetical protein PLICRDRAFT_459030 [Plicaturopsis crispa FD-325 SS-3]|nr:hypothetical protein PLICRDRAFT_459030 [Plicaturopsis crispa FD-325 SS-3]